jgi:hypothetical protein
VESAFWHDSPPQTPLIPPCQGEVDKSRFHPPTYGGFMRLPCWAGEKCLLSSLTHHPRPQPRRSAVPLTTVPTEPRRQGRTLSKDRIGDIPAKPTDTQGYSGDWLWKALPRPCSPGERGVFSLLSPKKVEDEGRLYGVRCVQSNQKCPGGGYS